MSEATQQPMMVHPVTPYLTVEGANEAIAFYQRAFGATLVHKQDMPSGGKVMHASLVLNGGAIFLSDDFPEMNGGRSSSPKAFGGSPVTIHLNVPDVDALWARAVAAGATVVMPLADQFWGDRYGLLTDPFGHRWSLSTRVKSPSKEDIDEAAKKQFG
jgi:PhnB protein